MILAALMLLPPVISALQVGPMGPVAPSSIRPTSTRSGRSWVNLTADLPSTPPTGFTGTSMVYDAADGSLVLLTQDHASSTTWMFVNDTWTALSTAGAGPGGFTDTSMVYDARDGYVVLFGGDNGLDSGSTWIFNGRNWTWWEAPDNGTTCYTDPPVDHTTAPCPSANSDLPIAYDAADQYVLLEDNGTWAFRGGNWSFLTSTEVPGDAESMVYDPQDGYVLDVYDRSTYTYHAGTWTNLSLPTQPPARYFPAVTYDAVDACVVLFGGALGPYYTAATYEYLNDTWTYRGGVWTNRTTAVGPSARASAAIAFDGAINQTILIGGRGTHGTWEMFNDTWAFRLSPGAIAMAHPDPSEVGRNVSFVEAWDGSPAPSSFAWNFGDGTGSSAPTASHAYAALGTYPATAWANSSAGVSATSSIVVRVAAALQGVTVSKSLRPVYAGEVVNLSGAFTGGVAPYRFVWRISAPNGTWSAATPGPSYLLPFAVAGNTTIHFTVSDAAGVRASALLQFVVLPSPSALSTSVVLGAAGADVFIPLRATANVTGGLPPYLVHWSVLPYGGANVTGQTSQGSNLSVTFGAPGVATLGANVSDSFVPAHRATSEVVVAVHPWPTVRIVGPGGPFDAQTQPTFTAAVSGGTAPFRAAWGFGDRTNGSGLSVSHSYATAGRYRVHLTVTDAFGRSANATLNLTVLPALAARMTVSNSTPVLGVSVLFQANASGGLSPYSFSWSGLPLGCYSVDNSTIGCLPTQAGDYDVVVTVGDGTGAVATAGRFVNITFDFTAAIATSTHLGEPLTVHVEVRGGFSPLTYNYTGLPSGCVSIDAPSFTCTPDAVGTYHLDIRVVDAVGHRAAHTYNVTVTPAPPVSISSIEVGGLGLVVATGAAVGFVVWRRRRRPLPIRPPNGR